mgnify:CR=1 FL=1
MATVSARTGTRWGTRCRRGSERGAGIRGTTATLARAGDWYILEDMKQILLEVDDRMAAKLEAIAPARSRKRSEFLRKAIQQAIWDIEEAATREAYERQPDSAEPPGLDPRVWDPRGWPQPRPQPQSRKTGRKR